MFETLPAEQGRKSLARSANDVRVGYCWFGQLSQSMLGFFDAFWKMGVSGIDGVLISVGDHLSHPMRVFKFESSLVDGTDALE